MLGQNQGWPWGFCLRYPILAGPRLSWFDPSKFLYCMQSSPVVGKPGWLVTLPLTLALCSVCAMRVAAGLRLALVAQEGFMT